MKFDIFLTDIDQLLPKILVNVIFFPHAVGRFRMPCDIFLTLFYLSFHTKKEEPRTWRKRLRLYLAYRCCIQRSWVWQCTWFQQFHGSCDMWQFKVPCRHHISQHLRSKYSINILNPETRTLKSFDLIHVPSKITIVYSEWFDFKSHETCIWNQFSLYAGNSWEVWTLGEIFRTSS